MQLVFLISLLMSILFSACDQRVDSDETSSPLNGFDLSTLYISSADHNSSSSISNTSSQAQVKLQGFLDISVIVQPLGGKYYQSKGVAVNVIWIEDQDGNYLRTLERFTKYEYRNLGTWYNARELGGVDGITSATKAPGLREANWDFTDYLGQDVGPGLYQVFFETSEDNGKSTVHSVDFELTQDNLIASIVNTSIFNNIQLTRIGAI